MWRGIAGRLRRSQPDGRRKRAAKGTPSSLPEHGFRIRETGAAALKVSGMGRHMLRTACRFCSRAVLCVERAVGSAHASGKETPDSPTAQAGIMVDKDFQGKGIGRALMLKMLDLADNWLMLTPFSIIIIRIQDVFDCSKF